MTQDREPTGELHLTVMRATSDLLMKASATDFACYAVCHHIADWIVGSNDEDWFEHDCPGTTWLAQGFWSDYQITEIDADPVSAMLRLCHQLLSGSICVCGKTIVLEDRPNFTVGEGECRWELDQEIGLFRGCETPPAELTDEEWGSLKGTGQALRRHFRGSN